MEILTGLGLRDHVPYGIQLSQRGAQGQNGRLAIKGDPIVPHAVGERRGRTGSLL
jgi:hypothetical protein